MGDATWAISNFLGGEISQYAQGRFDRPDYRVSLNICLNAFPVEIGPWTRRPGTAYGSHPRAGSAGRVIEFDFEQSDAATCEYTDGFVRFRNGTALIGTNDNQTVTSVSTANPAVVAVPVAVNWATGNTVIFPGASTPLLENRQFTVTRIDSQHFSLADALTGATIDGSTLGALVAGATIMRVQELATPYLGTSWQSLRTIQAETTQVLLCPGIAPQALTVSTLPATGVSSQFALQAAVFNDGPYLDPFTNGVQVTPSAVSGLVNLTLSFAQYSATQAYAKGSFATSAGIDYQSLQDQNVGNTPATSPAFWAATTAGVAINNGQGFLSSDIGRLIRMLSEPAYFLSTTTYTSGAIVSYNPSGVPGATTYWQAQTSTTGSPPGADLINWKIIPQGAAIWTWGKITGLSNIINRNLAGSVAIGDMTLFNGTASAFDGNFTKSIGSSAGKSASGGSVGPNVAFSISGFAGKNFTGASPQKIQQASVYPSDDRGFGFGNSVDNFGQNIAFFPEYTINLRASQTAPANSSNGTLLGTESFSGSSTAISIISTNQTTAWNYVWFEVIMLVGTGNGGAQSYNVVIDIAQISLYSPTATTTLTAGCTAEILGPALLYTNTVLTWRMGAYSNTTGWPTDGCYADGRLWLGGAIANRFDACSSNGLLPGGNVINFAPTDQYGVVADDNAISETINADDTNPIYWMKPDLQGVLIGTQGGEFLLQAPTTGSISPSNITSRRTTRIGSQNIEPCRTEHTLIFVKRYGQKLMEYFADVYSGKFTAPNLAERAQHITSAGVAELAYTEATTPILWGRDTAGALFGVTYKRDALTTSQGPTYAAFHRHLLGSGRIVESICSGPSTDGNLDSLTMVTNDPSTNIRHVEVLTDTPDELTELADCWFLDDAVNPTSIVSSSASTGPAPYGGLTINGLWHLNGKVVQVFAGGVDCGQSEGATFTDFTVTSGSVFVPYGDGVSAGSGAGQFTAAFVATLSLSQIVVGFTYNSDGQIVRRNEPAETGARNGPALGKLRRNHRYSLLVSNSLGVSVGATFSQMYPALFTQADGITPIAPLTTFSGVHQDSVQDDYSYDGMLCWRVSRPLPATVVALAGNIETMDQ